MSEQQVAKKMSLPKPGSLTSSFQRYTGWTAKGGNLNWGHKCVRIGGKIKIETRPKHGFQDKKQQPDGQAKLFWTTMVSCILLCHITILHNGTS
ncbi:MAG: hypothetical protein K8S55_12325 [Phycisphaerae bacterium]|nr:hypothetical protein [Phycisphaerae bacterium]